LGYCSTLTGTLHSQPTQEPKSDKYPLGLLIEELDSLGFS